MKNTELQRLGQTLSRYVQDTGSRIFLGDLHLSWNDIEALNRYKCLRWKDKAISKKILRNCAVYAMSISNDTVTYVSHYTNSSSEKMPLDLWKKLRDA